MTNAQQHEMLTKCMAHHSELDSSKAKDPCELLQCWAPGNLQASARQSGSSAAGL